MNILIAEDNRSLSLTLQGLLQRENHIVDAVEDGQSAVDYAAAYPYDLIILDIMLPRLDGVSAVHILRERHIDTPVLMLTARSETRHKIEGLNAGADDYMTKPFEPDELIARVNALTRRRGTIVMREAAFADLTLALDTAVLSRGELTVQLSRKEFSVLRILMENPQFITTKEVLIAKVWGSESGATDNNVEAYISFLRKKLRLLGSRVTIRNIHSIGYRLEEET